MGRQTTKTNSSKKCIPKKGELSTKTRKRRFLDALSASLGNISEAAKSVGINRRTYYDWIKDDQEFSQSVDSISESQIDYVESKLLERINDGDTTATIYYLKTKGRNRGWSEKIEIDAKISPFERLMMETEDD
ncbi:MAG: phBC6A51 family helix-turn-helix protein [Porphyromonadaceae bacterium]|nr:phBC6A51 family helix-turn-helix protein [Porphyromonadaceae bacterium]